MSIKNILKKHGVKQASRVVTKPAPNGGRAVVVTETNFAAIAAWLGEALVLWEGGEKSKVKLKTKKGPRVAVVGDTIIKYGTRRNKGAVTFVVEKAS